MIYYFTLIKYAFETILSTENKERPQAHACGQSGY